MGIRPHQRVGIGDRFPVALPGEDHLGQILEVDLVHDARAGRDDAEVVEGPLPPLEEAVPLQVPVELAVHVGREGAAGAELVHLYGVVDDQVHVLQGVDAVGRAAQLPDGVPHGGQVDDGRHAREVLHQHPRRAKGDLPFGGPACRAFDDGGHVLRGDRHAVFVAQQVLHHDLEGEGKTRNVPGAAFLGP